MSDTTRFMLLNLPNPPGLNIYRGYAGGFGTLGGTAGPTLLPIYLLYTLSAAITSGCEYRVLDAQALGYDTHKVIETVKINDPDILISWLSLPSLSNDIQVLNQIKKEMPGIRIIAFGAICNVMPEEILSKSSIDFIIKGRYPFYTIMMSLINMLKQNPLDQNTFNKLGAICLKEGRLFQDTQQLYNEDLDQLSFDAYGQLPVRKYISEVPDARGSMIKYIPLLSSVGCPYSCIYCPYPIGYGRTVLQKSIKRIVDEIDFLKTKFGISGFMFRDQVFSHDKERVIRLCDEIIGRKLDINWFVEGRVDEVSETLLRKMKEAGCIRILYGVETGAAEHLKKVGKPGMQIETIKKAFMAAKEYDIGTTAFMILGLPGENKDTLRNSLDLLREIKPDHANINVATPYPGTRLYEISKEQGWISTFDWSKYTSYNAILNTSRLNVAQVDASAKSLRRGFRNFKLRSDANYRKFYAKKLPEEIIKRIKLSISS